MSSIHEPLTGVISTLHPAAINVIDIDNDSKRVGCQRQPEGLDFNVAAVPASSTSADVPRLPYNLTLHSHRSFEEPFHGLPIEIRLMIWEYIIMPAIKVAEKSSHQAMKTTKDALRFDPRVRFSPPRLQLWFNPRLTTLTSLQVTNRIVRAEVSELLDKHGVIIDVEGLQSYSIQTVLGCFSSSHAPRIASLRMRARDHKNGLAGNMSFARAFGMLKDESRPTPRLTRLDYVVDTPSLWGKAIEVATRRRVIWENLKENQHQVWIVKAMAELGFGITHAHEMVSSGHLDEIRLVLQYHHSDEVKFLGRGWERLVAALSPLNDSKADICNRLVPDPYVSGAETWVITFTRHEDSESSTEESVDGSESSDETSDEDGSSE